MNSFARKDFFFCLGIWLAIEIFCFGLLPLLRLAEPNPPIEVWFKASLIGGIGGAALIAYGTHLAASAMAKGKPPRRPMNLLISLLSWLGLLGIAFPLMFASAQVFAKLLTLTKI
ncbi:MAG: hypothetical protein HY785_04265 [Oscillatoriophycideae cyanobacterium NC_groundwater_1537_Pr4_S-0.65um_50_18]|nr:hypothetical protein [Oscillatoriophycideae cyanobacterium NC_groundwater_1537_Pr4_S-0.65um_50_18]